MLSAVAKYESDTRMWLSNYLIIKYFYPMKLQTVFVFLNHLHCILYILFIYFCKFFTCLNILMGRYVLWIHLTVVIANNLLQINQLLINKVFISGLLKVKMLVHFNFAKVTQLFQEHLQTINLSTRHLVIIQ